MVGIGEGKNGQNILHGQRGQIISTTITCGPAQLH